MSLSKFLVKISSLHYAWGDHRVFRSVNINAERGKITAIMGPSGTGKTTLLQLIGAQISPDRGKVIVDGQDIHRLKSKALYQARQKMGVLFQNGALFTGLNVFENVAFPLREHTNLPEGMLHDLVLLKLSAVGLRGARDLMPSELSGGMARRVAMARALALDPQLMMYDEPFAGQDPITTAVLVDLIKRLNQAFGLTSLVISHDVAMVHCIADYMYLLAEGRVIGEGTPAELMADKAPWVKQFMHGLADGAVPFQYPAHDYRQDLGLINA